MDFQNTGLRCLPFLDFFKGRDRKVMDWLDSRATREAARKGDLKGRGIENSPLGMIRMRVTKS